MGELFAPLITVLKDCEGRLRAVWSKIGYTEEESASFICGFVNLNAGPMLTQFVRLHEAEERQFFFRNKKKFSEALQLSRSVGEEMAMNVSALGSHFSNDKSEKSEEYDCTHKSAFELIDAEVRKLNEIASERLEMLRAMEQQCVALSRPSCWLSQETTITSTHTATHRELFANGNSSSCDRRGGEDNDGVGGRGGEFRSEQHSVADPGHNQDLTLRRIDEFASVAATEIQAKNQALRRSITECTKEIDSLWREMDVGENEKIAFHVAIEDIQKQVECDSQLSAHDDATSTSTAMTINNNAAAVSRLPESVRRVFAIKSVLPVYTFTRGVLEKLQSDLITRLNIRLTETTQLLTILYKKYCAATGDPSFAACPDYSVFFASSPNVSLAGRISTFKEAIAVAENEVELMEARLSRVSQILPLLSKRDEILKEKEKAESFNSKETLCDRKVNSAKILLEQERVRTLVKSTLPKLEAKIMQLCNEWAATDNVPMFIRGHDVRETIAAPFAPNRHDAMVTSVKHSFKDPMANEVMTAHTPPPLVTTAEKRAAVGHDRKAGRSAPRTMMNTAGARWD